MKGETNMMKKFNDIPLLSRGGEEKNLQHFTRKEVQLFTRTSFQQRERGDRYLISVALGGVIYAY